MCWRCVLVQDPLIETLISHLVEIPEADKSFSVATDVEREVRVRFNGIGVVIVRDQVLGVVPLVVGGRSVVPELRWARLMVLNESTLLVLKGEHID